MSYGAGPKALVAVVSSALVAAAVGVGFAATRNSEPVPVVNAWEEQAPAGTEDGLVRFEVTVDRTILAATATAGSGSGATAAGTGPTSADPDLAPGSGTGVDERALSEAAAAMLTQGGRPQLRFLDGGAWVVDANGRLPRVRIPFDGTLATTAPAAPAGTAPVTDSTVVDTLADAPGVSWAAPMGGDRFLVVARPDVDPRGIEGVTAATTSPTVQLAEATLPTEPNTSREWWAPRTQVADAFSRTHGEQIVVAVIDTITDPTRMDAQVWQNTDEVCGNRLDDDGNGYVDDCNGWNFYTNTGDVGAPRSGGITASDHGTAVSAAVAAAVNGVEGFGMAPGVAIMPVPFGTASSLSLAAAIAAIRYAVDNGADIINCSWGGEYAMPAELDAALAYAQQKGVLVVVAAGNSSMDANRFTPASSTRPNVLTVGSTGYAVGVADSWGPDIFISDNMSSFSNYSNTAVDLFTPGAGIWLPSLSLGHYTWMHGTSFSSPLTAGAAALVKSLQPSLTGTTLRSMLMASVDPVPALSGRAITGGRLNVAKAVDLVPEIRTEYRAMQAPDPANPGDPYDVTAAVHLSGVAPSDVPGDTPLDITVGLVRRGTSPSALDGTSVAVADRPLSMSAGTVTAPMDVTADTLAAAVDGIDLPLSVSLPAGEYALVTQVVDPDGIPVTTPVGARFYVGPPPGSSTPTTAPTSLSPTPTAVTPTAVAPTSPTSPAPTTSSSAPATLTPIPVLPPAPTSGAPAPSVTTTAPAAPPVPGTPTTPTTPAAPSSSAGSTTAPAPLPPTTSAPGAPTAPATSAAPTRGNAQPTTTPPPSNPSTTSAPAPVPTAPTTTTAPAPTSAAPTSAPATAPTSAAPTAAPTTSAPTPVPTVSVPSTPHFGITKVVPGSGSIDGNTLATLFGTDLPPSGYLRVGGVAADVVAWGDRSQLSFYTPPGFTLGPVNIDLCSRNGHCDTVTGGFTYTASLVAPTTRPPVVVPTSSTPTSTAPTSSTPTTAPAVPGAPTTSAPAAPTTSAPAPGVPGAPTTSAPASPGVPAPGPTTTSPTTWPTSGPTAGPTSWPTSAVPTTSAPGAPSTSTTAPAAPAPTPTSPRARLRTVAAVLGSATLFTTLPAPCTGGTCNTAVL